MTKMVDGSRGRGVAGSANQQRCRWCRRVMVARPGPGRPKVFCSQACRQWDWVSRQRARELQISENELVVARRELERLYDDLYVLSCAIEDTDRELSAGRPTVASLRETLQWLLDAARPLHNRTVAPHHDQPIISVMTHTFR